MRPPPNAQMTKEMLSDFKKFIASNPNVTAEVLENKAGTYLLLGEIEHEPSNGKETYMILLTAERKQ